MLAWLSDVFLKSSSRDVTFVWRGNVLRHIKKKKIINNLTQSKGYPVSHCISECYSNKRFALSDIWSHFPQHTHTSIDQLILLIPSLKHSESEDRGCSSESSFIPTFFISPTLDGFVSCPWAKTQEVSGVRSVSVSAVTLEHGGYATTLMAGRRPHPRFSQLLLLWRI